jgi:uncharacterized protein YbbC (DUF1343 family)/CubicO group peptidase (beta-lactamase class C family)
MVKKTVCICTLLVIAGAAVPAAFAQPSAGAVEPIDPARLSEADRHINDAIVRGDIPGAVLHVGRGGGTLYLKAYGNRAVQPERAPMTTDTIFDLASLSKPIGCATSIMILIERGKIDPGEKVAKYLPDFGVNGKEDITVAQLLLHHGGLIPDNPLSDYTGDPAGSLRNINNLKTISKPGTKFAYTDVGYIVLGELVKAVDPASRGLDRFAREEVFEPLGMNDTSYMPPDAWKPRVAPTEMREGRWMVGEVHDPRAFALGGFAGHAGLFGTAEDVGRYCRMIIRGGRLDGRRILDASTVRRMTTPRPLPDGTGVRSYGFDVDTAYSSPRGNRFERGTTFGHTGFTGTSMWIDPANDCFVVLLTNSVHPEGKGKAVQLRRLVSTAVAEALLGPAPATQPSTRPTTRPGRVGNVIAGIDVLKRDNFQPLQGKRVAVVTNHSGLDRAGNRTVDLLIAADGVKVAKIFSPEHGLYGVLDEKVSDAIDPKTGLKVYSLYGKSNKPSNEMLEGVDVLVYDIQDAGARYYTYISTMGLCMEACAANDVKMVVLDRPNPVTGRIVDGPLADEDSLGFTAYAPIPVSHGMTVGELAKMFNAERKIGCDLTVVPMEGWRRSMWFDETGLMWVNPSPNLRNPTQALVYLAVGQIEAANLSVGRGTDQPFEIFGAPWIDGRKLAAALNEANLPGLRFTPITFTPKSSKHANKECQGVYITVTDRTDVEPVRAGPVIAWHLHRLFGKDFQVGAVNNLLKSTQTMERIKTAKDPCEIAPPWEKPLEEFKAVRAKYLMYE